MSTSKMRGMILEYWFRVLIGSDISIDDISKITVAFANEFEMFDESLSHKSLKIEIEGQIIYKDEHEWSSANGFGNFIASKGRIYHWTIKVIEALDQHLNIGIIEADAWKETLKKQNWWNSSYGYSYYGADGELWHDAQQGKVYGESYTAGDIIHIWVDLQDEKPNLSFSKNDKKYDEIKINRCKDYKLAIGMYGESKKLEILSFEINEIRH